MYSQLEYFLKQFLKIQLVIDIYFSSIFIDLNTYAVVPTLKKPGLSYKIPEGNISSHVVKE